MNRREQIRMSEQEVEDFLAAQRVVICATNGREGWPHLMPLWYVVRGGEIWTWTYAKSQKVRNLERDARATLQLEDGERYEELRGVMVEAETVIHRDHDAVTTFGSELFDRYGSAPFDPQVTKAIRAQASKRVALQFVSQRLVSWDHRKLGGTY